MKKSIFTILLLGIIFLGCSPEDGEDGATGPQGVAGEQGEQGEPGTANVIYSEWVQSEFPDVINDTFYQWGLPSPDLTTELLQNGSVLVYARKGSIVYPIPQTFFSVVQQHWGIRFLEFNTSIIPIRVQSTDDTNIGSPYLNGEFRYIIIPGGLVTSNGKSPSTLDFTKINYEELIAYFNIPE